MTVIHSLGCHQIVTRVIKVWRVENFIWNHSPGPENYFSKKNDKSQKEAQGSTPVNKQGTDNPSPHETLLAKKHNAGFSGEHQKFLMWTIKHSFLKQQPITCGIKMVWLSERLRDPNDYFSLWILVKIFSFLNLGINKFIRERKQACITWLITVLCINSGNSLILANLNLMAR